MRQLHPRPQRRVVPGGQSEGGVQLRHGVMQHGVVGLVRALELASPVDIREQAEKLFITPGEVTRAVLAALGGARQVE